MLAITSKPSNANNRFRNIGFLLQEEKLGGLTYRQLEMRASKRIPLPITSFFVQEKSKARLIKKQLKQFELYLII